MKVPRKLRLIPKRHDIRRTFQTELFVTPQCPRDSATSLRLIHAQEAPIFLANLLQVPKEISGRLVRTLVLHRLHHNPGDRAAVFFRCAQQFPDGLQTFFVLMLVVTLEFVQGMFVPGKLSNRPIKSGNIHFIFGIGMRHRKCPHSFATMIRTFEAEDAQIRGAGMLVVDCGFERYIGNAT